jgi:hypothetical protein
MGLEHSEETQPQLVAVQMLLLVTTMPQLNMTMVLVLSMMSVAFVVVQVFQPEIVTVTETL